MKGLRRNGDALIAKAGNVKYFSFDTGMFYK